MEIMYVERRASRKSETMVLKAVVELRMMEWGGGRAVMLTREKSGKSMMSRVIVNPAKHVFFSF